MVPSTNGARVLVTGATGYIGAHVVDQFLQEGYVVVGSSRSATKALKIENYFKNKYGDKRFEIYEASSIDKEGVFDEAVKDVEVIAHLATPVSFFPKDPIADVINPAINGTLNIMNSAHKYGKNVKHVIVMSSVSSILNLELEPSHVLDEEDWNDGVLELVKQSQETGQDLMPGMAYDASKNAAERALWQFRNEKKPSFTLTTLLPSWVYGAIIPPPATEQDVKATSTAKVLVEYFSGENQNPRFSFPMQGWVHVTDVARAHLLVIQNADKADGERYVLNAGKYSFQEVVDIFRKNFPERQNVIAKGEPGNYPEPMRLIAGGKITREIGLQYNTDFEQTILDTVKSAEHLYKL